MTAMLNSSETACPFDPTRASTMATSTFLDFRCADSTCEWADRPEKQELVARQDLLFPHSTLESFDSDTGLRTATEASDDESWGEWKGGPVRDERFLASKANARPKVRPSKRETLSLTRSSVDEAAARMVDAERRVAIAKKKLQDAEALVRIDNLKTKLRALQDAEEAKPKIRPPKKETLNPARAPDTRAVLRLGVALGQVASLKKLLRPTENVPRRKRFHLIEIARSQIFYFEKTLRKARRAIRRGSKGPSGGGRNNKRTRGRTCESKRSRFPMPKELIGLEPVTEDGERICFAYNLPKGCNAAAKRGEICSKGLHVCAKKGRKEHHPYTGSH